jgi:FAD/FMN-containing dehydrogenase
MKRMNKVIRVDRRNKVGMVEPGVTFGELIPELEAEGLAPLMGLAPRASKSVMACALEREPIIMPHYHWENQDPLRCVEIVYGTGDMFRTGSAAGPGSLEEQWEVGRAQVRPMGPSFTDFAKLVQGSQGTMGIVTWATVGCRPLPSVKKLFFIPSNNLEALVNFTYKLLWKKLGAAYFIVNNHNLACLAGRDPESIHKLRNDLPEWVAVVSIEGFGLVPEVRADYQKAEIEEVAQAFGLEPVAILSELRSDRMLDLLSQPCEEPYWKLRFKGGCQDIFFITTLDKTPEFITRINNLAAAYKLPIADMGVYLQPTIHGTNCHCEFNLSYDPKDKRELDRVKAFHAEAPVAITDMHGFFSRPYGSWAKVAYGRSAESVMVQRKVKGIFDPNNIMNPGKLCF